MREARQNNGRTFSIPWIMLVACVVVATALLARSTLTSRVQSTDVKTLPGKSSPSTSAETSTDKAAPESRASSGIDFELDDLSGKRIRLSDYRGKVVLVNFWATWCGPCQFEIPVFVKMKRQYQKRGFEVIGISMDDGAQEQVEEFVRQYEINYPVVMGAEARLDAFGRISGLPTSVIINREGRIHSRHQGLLGLNEIENELPKLLAAK